MKCTLSEMRQKEIINIRTGERLGYADDLEFDTDDASVKAIIIYGRSRFFGLLGREEDLIIRCKDIEVIGEDVLLISSEEVEPAKAHIKHTEYNKKLLKIT